MGGPQTVYKIKVINPCNHNANIPEGQPKGGTKTNFIVGYQNTLWPAIICVTLDTPSTYLMNSHQILLSEWKWPLRGRLLSLSQGVTLVHSLLLRLRLVLAKLPTCRQKNRRTWQYGACIRYHQKAQCFDIVTETNSTIMKAKLNQTVGVAGKNICFWSLFFV